MKKKVAVIATGFTGQQHTEAVRRLPGCEVVAIADANADALKAKAAQLGIERTFTDYREMIEEVRPDVVHNCTPNGLHYEINRYLIEKGIHVYSEKPLAITAREGQELADLARKNNVACGVNFNYRNNAIIQEMRERVKDGSIGRIFHVRGQYIQDWMMMDTDYNWRLTSDMGGASRTIADIGSHWFDTTQYLMGQKIVSVRAETLTVHPFRKKPRVEVETFAQSSSSEYELVPIDTEDAAFIHLKFGDGTYGSVDLSQVSGGHLNDFRIDVSGENYSMEWKQESCDTLEIGSREIGKQIIKAAPGTLRGDAARYATLPGGHPVGWADALRNAVREFYASIDRGDFAQDGMKYATFADGAYIMRIVDACMKSAGSGKWEEV